MKEYIYLKKRKKKQNKTKTSSIYYILSEPKKSTHDLLGKRNKTVILNRENNRTQIKLELEFTIYYSLCFLLLLFFAFYNTDCITSNIISVLVEPSSIRFEAHINQLRVCTHKHKSRFYKRYILYLLCIMCKYRRIYTLQCD